MEPGVGVTNRKVQQITVGCSFWLIFRLFDSFHISWESEWDNVGAYMGLIFTVRAKANRAE